MDVVDRNISWRFWGRWILTTAVGLIAGMILFILVGSFAGEALDASEIWFGLVIGTIFGLTIGFAQWWAMRSAARQSFWWILATILGFALGSVIVFGWLDGSNPDNPLLTRLSHGIVVGGLIGLGQYLVLRGTVARAWIWVLVNIAAWLIGELAALALSAAGAAPPFDLMVLFLLAGALPGAGMVWLLNQPQAPSP